jgi:hypothetical protein
MCSHYIQQPQLMVGGAMQISVASRVTAGLRTLAGRPGGDGAARAALFVSGTVLSQAITRTIHSKNRGDLSVGDSADDAGAIHWIGSIKKLQNMTLIGSGR